MEFAIKTLRNLVSNGWNITNRRKLQQIIGSDELKKLGQAYKKLEIDSYKDTPEVEGDIWIPTGAINLSQRNRIPVLTFPSHINGFYVPNSIQKFIGEDINLETITKKIHEFQQNTINYFKNAKEFPESALESKTMKKLFSPEFKTTQGINKDGYYVTTIIDKKTGKPVEAYIKCTKKASNYDKNQFEAWDIFVKNDIGEYEHVGTREFSINKQLKKYFHNGWILKMDLTDFQELV